MKIGFKLALLLLVLCWQTSCVIDPTYYDILKIKQSANAKEIQEAYKVQRARLQEIGDDRSYKKLALLEQAYSVMRDEAKRAKYERYGKDGMKTANEINPQNDYRKGPLIKLKLPVTLQQVVNGANITMTYLRNKACPVCQGWGYLNPAALKTCTHCGGKGYQMKQVQMRNGQMNTVQQACGVCHGSGKAEGRKCHSCKGKKLVNELETLNITIQKGLPNGREIRIRNAGDQRQLGAPSDLLIELEQITQSAWRRERGNTLIYKMPITLQESILGINRQIKHLDGRKLKIKTKGPITPNSKLTLKGQGINKGGQLRINFNIEIPKFNDDQLDMWEVFFDSLK